jgi:signal transduction histidine kinase
VTFLAVRGGLDWWRSVRGLLVMAALVASVISSDPHAASPVLIGSLVLVVAGWSIWALGPGDRWWARLCGVLLVGGGGVMLAVLHPYGAALAFPAVACANAASRWPPRWAIALTAVLAVGFVTGSAAAGRSGWYLLIGPAVFLIALMGSLVRRQNLLLAQESQLIRGEQAHSEALAERARIAREIHDLLAHSLAALTVQLETADALLEGGRTEQARQSVARAGQLAREGLTETRRAIGALRGDTLPLPELLDALAGGYRTDLGAPARVQVTGQPRVLTADTSLALYRTAQEAMTNIRKHAPGAPVTVSLDYRPDTATLAVCNGAAPAGIQRPLAGTGGGYGLTGLRERAELAGGRFTAGPVDGGWRVDVRIPT